MKVIIKFINVNDDVIISAVVVTYAAIATVY